MGAPEEELKQRTGGFLTPLFIGLCFLTRLGFFCLLHQKCCDKNYGIWQFWFLHNLQRGAGKSTPHACLEENTTWDLVEDVEKIRKHLGIEEWIVLPFSVSLCFYLIIELSVIVFQLLNCRFLEVHGVVHFLWHMLNRILNE